MTEDSEEDNFIWINHIKIFDSRIKESGSEFDDVLIDFPFYV